MIKKLDLEYRIDEYDLAYKLNEVIDELNRREEVPTDTTVSCSDCNTNSHTFLCCPERYPKESAKKEKLYLTAEGMRAYDGSKWA